MQATLRAVVPVSSQTVKVPAQFDWVSVSKIVVIEAAFLASIVTLLFLHPEAAVANEALAVAISTGATLGLLRVTDVVANIANVRAFLNAPGAAGSGIVPQAAGTPLLQTVPTPVTNGAA